MKPIRRGKDMLPEPMKKFRDEFDNMFERFFKEPFFSTTSAIFDRESFTPACNIEETDNQYTIEAEMPGIDPDQIEIEISSNQLTIKGERKSEVETKDDDKQMHVVERSYGSYFRSFTLPENVNTDAIEADYKNGVLYIDIPKTESDNVRKIKIEKRD